MDSHSTPKRRRAGATTPAKKRPRRRQPRTTDSETRRALADAFAVRAHP